jgi:hypothetical protein
MHTLPRLVINICDRLPNGFVSFGLYDMTLPAAAAIADKAFDTWSTGYIPATVRVCMHVSHEARTAAWNGRLYSYDLPHMADPFAASVARFGGHDRLLEYLETKYAARGIRRHAEAIMAEIESAEFVQGSKLKLIAHPITGEVKSSSDPVENGDIPFAFAGIEAIWKGVDARELFDFTRDRGGVPDAMEYLAANFSRPDDAVSDLEGLDAAVHALRHSRDPGLFRQWISEWNSKQDVRMRFKDERRAVGLGAMRGKDDALHWCRQYLASAIDLEGSVDALYSNANESFTG